jgi:hypothetical protein
MSHATDRLALIARVLAQPEDWREAVWYEWVVPSRTPAAAEVDALCDQIQARARRMSK